MKEQVYNFKLDFNWRLMGVISQLDRFDASWSSIEKREGQSLKELKSIASIMSVGASTRIEGSKMSDAEVEVLLNNIDISKIEDRDSQEVVGYSNVLDLIINSFDQIFITENNIKNLHNQLLRVSEKDQWHRGDYKKHVNAVEAKFADGSRQIIFKTTEPGFATDDAMRQLVEWYQEEKEVHPIIKTAAFVYDFLSIHPFQDGNGRLSRLLTTLLLLQSGYLWVQYVSFEHEVEKNKKEYYKSLRSCQAQRPNEDITEWIDFFLNSLMNIQNKLSRKLEITSSETNFSQKEKLIYMFISNYPGCKSGEIAKKLNIKRPTLNRILAKMVSNNIIERRGKGAGVSYTIK